MFKPLAPNASLKNLARLPNQLSFSDFKSSHIIRLFQRRCETHDPDNICCYSMMLSTNLKTDPLMPGPQGIAQEATFEPLIAYEP